MRLPFCPLYHLFLFSFVFGYKKSTSNGCLVFWFITAFAFVICSALFAFAFAVFVVCSCKRCAAWRCFLTVGCFLPMLHYCLFLYVVRTDQAVSPPNSYLFNSGSRFEYGNILAHRFKLHIVSAFRTYWYKAKIIPVIYHILKLFKPDYKLLIL